MEKITLNHITKIEGHAKLALGIENGEVKQCELSSVEGSRYFEGIVRGRRFNEASEITSRICGICSCAHVITSIQAIENALHYIPTEQTETLRVLLTLSERIRSHATHLYFLALPDYTGYESALAMAPKFKKELKQALRLMKIGNGMIKILGGRDLHPVSATVGGWLSLPTQEEFDTMARDLESIKADASATCDLFSNLTYPDFETKGEWYSLVDKHHYAVLHGTFKSFSSSFEKKHYRKFVKEYHEEHSTANFVVKGDHRYMVGALPRLNNNHRQLSSDAKKMLKQANIPIPTLNPFYNNIAQAVELVHCIDHAIDICRSMKVRKERVDKVGMRAGTGVGAIEVPRGTLWHEYTLDKNGMITNANIITPTAQNLLNMQEDIRAFVPRLMDKKKEDIVIEIEKLIRSYDPCFSCSAHFLEVKWL
ncbi:Ni/Fe hydrogenase subunit alpha [Candidatus Woesearchaeota archaeon]|nr:Ni/Fe hydrogenase subunit alpha [Candidatus Woesearchaeota archaeon]